MIPAGYLLKRVSPRPEWLAASTVRTVCSLSDCVSENAVDLLKSWRHNSFGLANSPDVLWSLAAPEDLQSRKTALFYYEAFEQEMESDGWVFDPADWRPLRLSTSPTEPTAVAPPEAPLQAKLLGYDVVVVEDVPAHSPLSCNSVAAETSVNEHCLFPTLEAARHAIDTGAFAGGCEPGVYRIFSVSAVVDG